MTLQERNECLRLYGLGFTIPMLVGLYDRDRSIIDRLVGRLGARRGHKFRKDFAEVPATRNRSNHG